MTWRCPNIENSIVFYDNGDIRPCCVIDLSYKKTVDSVDDPNRFMDLYQGEQPPRVCAKCHNGEAAGIGSTRLRNLELEIQRTGSGIKFLDLRHSNLCNAKCRMCGSFHSSKWAAENGENPVIRHLDIEPYLDRILTEDLIEIYFAGGEPFMNPDHLRVLDILVQRGLSEHIRLRYNSNLSLLAFKGRDVGEIWQHFRQVQLMASADGTGKVFDYLRSDLDWKIFEKNLFTIREKYGVHIHIQYILHNLNIWWMHRDVGWFRHHGFDIAVDAIRTPPGFRLNHIPADKKSRAEDLINQSRPLIKNNNKADYFVNLLNQPEDPEIWQQHLDWQRNLDRHRKEGMIDLLKEASVI